MISMVLDTSVAVAWYLPEAFAVAARDWRRRMMAGEVEFLVPPLHYYEMGNVLRKYVVRRNFSKAMAREIFALHAETPLKLASPAIGSLLDTSFEYNATVYDAVYISLVLDRQIPLLTAERSTTPWVVKLRDLAVSVL